MNILAVGAHPDDVELGCGATLALYRARGHKVNILVLTKGEASGNPRVRERQCRQSAETLGVDRVFFGGFRDTRVDEGIENISLIEKVSEKTRSEVIFTHSPKDKHQDHRNTGLATLSAAGHLKTILLYESPTALREFCPQVFVDVTSSFPIKMKALQMFGTHTGDICYRGLHRKNRVDNYAFAVNAVAGLARYRGFQAGTQLAEAFEVGKFMLDVLSVSGNRVTGK